MVITFCKKSWNCWRELNASAVPSTSTNVSAVVINRTREVGGEAEAGIMTVFHVLGLLVYLCVSHWELDLHSWSHACGQPFSPLPPSHLRVFSAPLSRRGGKVASSAQSSGGFPLPSTAHTAPYRTAWNMDTLDLAMGLSLDFPEAREGARNVSTRSLFRR